MHGIKTQDATPIGPDESGPVQTTRPDQDDPQLVPIDEIVPDAGLTDDGVPDEQDEDLQSAAVADPSFAPKPTVEPIATVVIVNYNGAHLLGPCLDGLARQDMPAGSFRTMVVDNASADPSRDLVTEEYPDVELLISTKNRGFAGGNNVALNTVTTKYAVLLNNDAVPEPDWLRTLIEPLEQDPTGELVATSSKIVFMPRFVPVSLQTEPFKPGGLDPRELGIKIYEVFVDGTPVTDRVLFEKATFGPEGTADEQYRWSFPSGKFFVPLPTGAAPADSHAVTVTVAAFRTKDVTFTAGESVTTVSAPDAPRQTATAEFTVTPDTERVDVVNNVGGIVFVDGSGADRGFQEVDTGQYDQSEEVFTACGNGVAIRTRAGREVGWFDDRYFMYYEDVDLSWRLRAAGGHIRYVPGAVLRHIHAASSTPWSPHWLFHVERNRLLTLTKDAGAARAAKGVLRFVGTTGKMTAREVIQGVRGRRRPSLGQVRVRGKILRSYLRLLPGVLSDRRRLGRSAVVDRRQLEEWLVTSR